MRLIHIFTTTKQYRDVVEALYCLDRAVKENVILSRDAQPLPENLANTRYIIAPERLRGWRFWWWAAKESKRLIHSSDSSDWIVSEQVVGVSAFLLRFCLNVRCPTLVFFVFPSIKFLMERGWSADQWSRPLKWAHQWVHIKDMLKRSAIDIISVFGADVISANSDEILRSLKFFTGSKRTALLPNPVRSIGASGSEERVAGEFNLLFVAAMQPHKGIAMAMEIVARLQQVLPNAKLTVVGGSYPWDEHWFRELLERYQRRCGSAISYRGKVAFEELSRVYRTADVFLFPSFYEGSPRVVCEAMQYGCAVVTSDLSGNRLIDPEGEALQYFPAGDIDAALKILKRLATDKERLEQVRAASRRVIESRFSSEQVAEILLNIYRPMLNEKTTEAPAPGLPEKSSAG
jgi:glycosyltransferase involved in cell wall biosynthesis